MARMLDTASNRPDLPSEIARRRTFAIISHPDAGKTTLTEKFLLFGGAIQMAGQVRAKGEAGGLAGAGVLDRVGHLHRLARLRRVWLNGDADHGPDV